MVAKASGLTPQQQQMRAALSPRYRTEIAEFMRGQSFPHLAAQMKDPTAMSRYYSAALAVVHQSHALLDVVPGHCTSSTDLRPKDTVVSPDGFPVLSGKRMERNTCISFHPKDGRNLLLVKYHDISRAPGRIELIQSHNTIHRGHAVSVRQMLTLDPLSEAGGFVEFYYGGITAKQFQTMFGIDDSVRDFMPLAVHNYAAALRVAGIEVSLQIESEPVTAPLICICEPATPGRVVGLAYDSEISFLSITYNLALSGQIVHPALAAFHPIALTE